MPINSKSPFVDTMNIELDSQTEQSPSVSGLTSQAGDNDFFLYFVYFSLTM